MSDPAPSAALEIPEALRARWEGLLEQPLIPVEILRGDLEDHLQMARREGAADPQLLERLVDGARTLLDGLGPEPAEEAHHLVQAAIVYLILQDDEIPDLDSAEGLDDDAALFDAVARHLGRPDLVVGLR